MDTKEPMVKDDDDEIPLNDRKKQAIVHGDQHRNRQAPRDLSRYHYPSHEFGFYSETMGDGPSRKKLRSLAATEDRRLATPTTAIYNHELLPANTDRLVVAQLRLQQQQRNILEEASFREQRQIIGQRILPSFFHPTFESSFVVAPSSRATHNDGYASLYGSQYQTMEQELLTRQAPPSSHQDMEALQRLRERRPRELLQQHFHRQYATNKVLGGHHMMQRLQQTRFDGNARFQYNNACFQQTNGPSLHLLPNENIDKQRSLQRHLPPAAMSNLPTVLESIHQQSVPARQDMIPSQISSDIPTNLPCLLAQPEDISKLSSHQVLLRYQIEAFQATEQDTLIHTRGRNKPITAKQVGIRCRHCSHVPVSRRQKGSTYFPATLLGLYQAAQNMSTTHIQCGLCTEMPDSIKHQFAHLLSTKAVSSGAGRPYWAKSAEALGLVDTEEGIHCKHDMP